MIVGLYQRCPYFTMSNCLQWQTHCKNALRQNAIILLHILLTIHLNILKKIRIINNAFNILTLVTPSNWLLELLERSKIKNVKT